MISGRVQGVGFRAFTKVRADELRVKGWVRNLRDGRVEALAAGHSTSLDDFSEFLKHGPSHSKVEDVICQIVDVEAIWETFEVASTGDSEWSAKF